MVPEICSQTDRHTHTHTDALITILCHRSRVRSNKWCKITTSIYPPLPNFNVHFLHSTELQMLTVQQERLVPQQCLDWARSDVRQVNKCCILATGTVSVQLSHSLKTMQVALQPLHFDRLVTQVWKWQQAYLFSKILLQNYYCLFGLLTAITVTPYAFYHQQRWGSYFLKIICFSYKLHVDKTNLLQLLLLFKSNELLLSYFG